MQEISFKEELKQLIEEEFMLHVNNNTSHEIFFIIWFEVQNGDNFSSKERLSSQMVFQYLTQLCEKYSEELESKFKGEPLKVYQHIIQNKILFFCSNTPATENFLVACSQAGIKAQEIQETYQFKENYVEYIFQREEAKELHKSHIKSHSLKTSKIKVL